ncbi:MerR family transcriptional regulator [Allobranchiibius sp. GilTou73]|uniref:DNA polymerase III subunit beta family protein n=1 Tax=Allobranchiibius sp. GilTou73 TaxID=2904523 RepID=UPI001F31BD25|nr:MerR family transcriptional regulator [Allobranchiibius sp. GilTou73]UIJ36227.1 MerR family transcriptional regulator [Allobranchiibius sp. GilTou73]
MASLSGLPVSALRFYDGAGVLAPSMVDPSSGYRFYQRSQVASARLVAHLRRVGLPLEDIRTVATEPATASAILAAHLGRLEAGLADARREISIVHQLLENTEITMHRCTLPAVELIRALREVRHAICPDPDEPRLNGVFLDSEPAQLRVVATDRYRLATSTVPTSEQTQLHLLLPAPAVDELLAGEHTGSLDIVVDDGTITLSSDSGTVRSQIPDVDFPSYRTLLTPGRRQVPVDAAALRAALSAGPTETLTRDNDGVAYDVSRLNISTEGVRVGASEDPDAVVVGVNREFLLQALEAGEQLTLSLDDPIAPLAIRNPARDGNLSILMPVRLDQPAERRTA